MSVRQCLTKSSETCHTKEGWSPIPFLACFEKMPHSGFATHLTWVSQIMPPTRWTMSVIRTLGAGIRTSLVCDVIQDGGLLTFLVPQYTSFSLFVPCWGNFQVSQCVSYTQFYLNLIVNITLVSQVL